MWRSYSEAELQSACRKTGTGIRAARYVVGRIPGYTGFTLERPRRSFSRACRPVGSMCRREVAPVLHGLPGPLLLPLPEAPLSSRDRPLRGKAPSRERTNPKVTRGAFIATKINVAVSLLIHHTNDGHCVRHVPSSSDASVALVVRELPADMFAAHAANTLQTCMRLLCR